MTDAEVRAAEKIAREWLNRARNVEGRMHNSARVGIVPTLCETIIKLAGELKAERQRGTSR